MRLGSWLRNVTQSPWRRSTRKIVLKNFFIICRSSVSTRRHGDAETRRSRRRVSASPYLRVSFIPPPEHDIQGTNNRHPVAHQAPPHHPVERLQIYERRRAHAHPVWLRGIVADNEVAQLALGRFERSGNLAHRRPHHPGH